MPDAADRRSVVPSPPGVPGALGQQLPAELSEQALIVNAAKLSSTDENDPSPPPAASDPRCRTRNLQPSLLSEVASVGLTPIPPRVPPPSSHLPQSQTTGSPGEYAGRSHTGDVDTGFLQIYGPEHEIDAERQELEACLESKPNLSDARQQELLQSFAETYWEHCYSWCPVLDRNTLTEELGRSALLANSLAVAASHIQPPLVPYEGPATYYKNATTIFYNDEETDSLTALKALSLFYWWAPRAPTTAHRHSSWWWTSVIIRHAQQMNIHREPSLNHPYRHRLDLSLRRRVWWTVFVSNISPTSDTFVGKTNIELQARERITALCQSKPCIIDPEDCNISEPTLADFPDDPASQKKGEIFIHWVRLCGIMGKVAKVLSRPSSTASSLWHLRQELVLWVTSLPDHLQLPIRSARTQTFDRDVHQLYLPYLTTIIVLHLKRSAHALPHALPPAILAASCIARILRDILSRGNARFLMAVTCWYSGTAFIALLQATRIQELSKEANENLDVLVHAVSQLQQMWASANAIRQGFDRLRGSYARMGTSSIKYGESSAVGPPETLSGRDDHAFPVQPATPSIPTQDKDFDWTELFPFVSPSTNKIAEVLLNGKEHGTATRLPSPENILFQDALFSQYQDLVEPFTDYIFDFSEMASQQWSSGVQDFDLEGQ
jgi:hypothetical protein